MLNRAVYSDVHGCADELRQLWRQVEKAYPGIEHWHLGDLEDRGPESGKVIEFCMNHFAGGVMGNHDSTILKSWFARKKRIARGDKIEPHPNPDKENTLSQLDDKKVKYLNSLPHLHIFDDVGLVIVHGGVLPYRSLYQQPPEICCRAQMIKPNDIYAKGRWWGGDATRQSKVKKSEAESREEGYVRWYEVYDYQYDCIYGHSVMGLEPYIDQREGYGKTIGIDTGSCFGGYLTAIIYPEMRIFRVLCKEYVEGKNVKAFKGMTWEKR